MAIGVEGPLEIGRRIRDLREKKGITQKEFAELLSVTQGRVSQIERGAAIPSGMLPVLCALFNVNEDYILKGKTDSGVDREYQDTGMSYRNKVNFALWNHDYKKVKHPVAIGNAFKLDAADPDYKEIAKILSKTDCTLTVYGKAIMDDDCFSGSGEELYPEIQYTFALRCLAISRGYEWEAFEIDRKYSNPDKLFEYSDTPFRDRSQGRVYSDEVEFVPYYFKMLTPSPVLQVIREINSDKTYTVSLDKLWRYRNAVDKARFNNHFIPQNVEDDHFIDRECPETIRYREDGSIDWEAEFRRFRDMVEAGVSGKTFTASNLLLENGQRMMSSVIFSGKEHDLGTFGRIGITSSPNGEIEFLIDDRRVTVDQMLGLLSMYEGWSFKYEFESR